MEVRPFLLLISTPVPAKAVWGKAASEPMSAKKDPTGEFLTKELTIANRSGHHARPAALFVTTASRFDSEIFVEKDGERMNGKSIIGLLVLGIGPGTTVTLHVKGVDASSALAELEALVTRKFDEE